MIGVGDVVVCVDDAPNSYWPALKLLEKGRLYRVTAVQVVGEGPDAGKVGFVLKGVPLSPRGGGCNARRFRKVLPADPAFIEQIRKLTPHRQGADA